MNNYNNVLDILVVPLDATEPISLAEAKEYLRVTDTAQDNVITQMITAARQAIEKATQRSLVLSEVVTIVDNSYGNIELPMQPFVGLLVIKDKDGNDITTDVEVDGLVFKRIVTKSDYYRCAYTAGYPAGFMPMDLKFAIYDQIAFMWENRGDQVDTASVCEKAWRTCIRYTRKPLLV